jgi:antitoxin component YwqK of YwqJK toxin-antitoxin module
MKQILIEKYIEPTEISKFTILETFSEYWHNKYGELHSSLGQPALIYHGSGRTVQHWYKNDKRHRDKNLPALIIYENGKITDAAWYENGKKHINNDKLACIYYYNGKKEFNFNIT